MLLSSLLAACGLVAAAAAQDATTTAPATPEVLPPPDMSLATFRERRQYQRGRLHAVKVDRCRSHAKAHFRREAREVAPDRRSEVLASWRARKERAQELGSKCLSTFLWGWFYSSGASCVKSKEGAWTSNTGNGYYGGFQADLSFQQTYGAEYYPPTANYWPPIAQIHMAYRGWLARGWAPWPTTSVMCGLR